MRRQTINADEQRTINTRRNAKAVLSLMAESEVVTKAFMLTRPNNCDRDDLVDAYQLSQKVESEDSDIRQIQSILCSKVGRKYAAAKLRELADLIDVLD